MLLEHPKNIIQIGHSFSERIDSETNKMLCVECGGKGFYLLVQVGNKKGELVSCECEEGFKYQKRGLMKHGKS